MSETLTRGSFIIPWTKVPRGLKGIEGDCTRSIQALRFRGCTNAAPVESLIMESHARLSCMPRELLTSQRDCFFDSLITSRAHPLGLSKNWTSEHRRTHKTIASLGNSWLEKIIKNGKLQKEGDNQRLAVVDVHFRLSLSEPKHVPDFVGRLVPRWISMLNGAQPWLPHPPQDGGGGNRNGNLNRLLSYGGGDDDDDVSNKNKGTRQSKKRMVRVYGWWAFGAASLAALVWALKAYSGVPQRTHFSVSKFVDCVLWLGLMWCLAAFSLWAARMVVTLTPTTLGYKRNGWRISKPSSAFSSGRDFVVRSKFDEWMAQNVIAVPSLVVSLFLLSDVFHYLRILTPSIWGSHRFQKIYNLLKFRVAEIISGAGRGFPLLFKKSPAGKKLRHSNLSSSRRRRR